MQQVVDLAGRFELVQAEGWVSFLPLLVGAGGHQKVLWRELVQQIVILARGLGFIQSRPPYPIAMCALLIMS